MDFLNETYIDNEPYSNFSFKFKDVFNPAGAMIRDIQKLKAEQAAKAAQAAAIKAAQAAAIAQSEAALVEEQNKADLIELKIKQEENKQKALITPQEPSSVARQTGADGSFFDKNKKKILIAVVLVIVIVVIIVAVKKQTKKSKKHGSTSSSSNA